MRIFQAGVCLVASWLFLSPAHAAVINSVQSFNDTIASSSASDTHTITSVTTANTFLACTRRVPTSAPDDHFTRFELTDSTTVTATRVGTASNTVSYHCDVIEFTSGVSVTAGDLTLTTTSATDSGLSSVDTSKTFVISTNSCTSTSNSTDDRCWAETNVASSTSITSARGDGGDQIDTEYFRVEITTGATVQDIQEDDLIDTTSTSGETITSVDLGTTFVVQSLQNANSGDESKYMVRGRLTNSTTLDSDRGGTVAGSDVDVRYYVVEMDDGTSVQHDGNTADLKDIAITGTTKNTTLDTAVVLAESFSIGCGEYDTSSNAAIDDAIATTELTTTTNLLMSIANSAGTANYSQWVVDWNETAAGASAFVGKVLFY